MTEENNLKNEQDTENGKIRTESDAAAKSLTEALRVSFGILKFIMIVLIILFVASGFRTVAPDEQALVLRFGKIQGIGENRLLGPGLHWVFPYPVDEIVKIQVEKKVNLPINSFWHAEQKRVPETLDPKMEGYCLTRSEVKDDLDPAAGGSDYNIVHSKWQLTYKIDDPERFFKNVYIDGIVPGQNYFDLITDGVKPILKDIAESAIVTTMVDYTIDEAIFEKIAEITQGVSVLLQKDLDRIDSGIKVESIQLTEITWPRQVASSFQAFIRASQTSQKNIAEAKSYADNALNEVAGPVAEELLVLIQSSDFSDKKAELAWDQLAGTSQEMIAKAQAYRTKVVENANANAQYLEQILPEYKKRPELVVQKIYQDAIEYVLNNTDEKMIIQPTQGTKAREIRVMLTRDSTIKKQTDKNEQGK